MPSFTDDSRPLLELDVPASAVDEGWEEREEPSYRTLAVAWVATATLVRLFIAGLPLGNGEAYYFSWSRFLDWSYYDHPPLTAWLVRLTTVFGATPAMVRLGPVLASGLFGLLVYRLAERLFRPRTALFALIIVTALPMFLVSSFVLNPEAPLAPLWVGFLLALEGMRRRDDAYRPLLAGLLLGVAFLAKYTAVLLVPGTLLFVVGSAPMRRWLRRPSFYAGGLVALAMTMPVILWNAARGWPSLRLHLVERASATVPVAGENTVNHLVEISSSGGAGLLQSALRVGVGQFLSYSPLLAPLLVFVLVRSLRRVRRDERDLFLAAFSWPVLLFLLTAMVRLKDAEQHWTMMGVMPAAILLGRYLDATWTRAKVVRGMAVAGVAVSAAALGLGILHAHTTALLRLFPKGYDPRADMINELVGWDQVRASVGQVANGTRGSVVLASNHYSMCGRLFFEMGDEPTVYCPTARRSAYDFFGRHDPPAKATVIAVTTDIHPELPEGLRDRTCSVADTVDVERGGRQVARYLVQSCPPVPDHAEERASRD